MADNPGRAPQSEEETLDFFPPQDNPERAAWFEATYPDPRSLKLQHFWRGIRSIKRDLPIIIGAVRKVIKAEEVNFSSKEVVKKFEQRMLKLGESLLTNIESYSTGYDTWNPVPDKWLQLWIMAFLYQVWLYDYDGTKEDIQEGVIHEIKGYNSGNVTSTKEEKESEAQSDNMTVVNRGSSSTKRQPTTLPPGKQFVLHIMSDDGAQELDSVRIDPQLTFADDGSTHDLKLVRKAFHETLKENSKPYILSHGRFGYEDPRARKTTFKRIQRQDELQRAITQLKVATITKSDEEKKAINFYWYPEDALGKEMREQKAKANKSTARNILSGEKGKTTERPNPKEAGQKAGASHTPGAAASIEEPASKTKTALKSFGNVVRERIGGRPTKSQQPTPDTAKPTTGQGTSTCQPSAPPKNRRISTFFGGPRGDKQQKPEDEIPKKEKQTEVEAVGFDELSHDIFIKGSKDEEKLPTLLEDVSALDLNSQDGSEESETVEVEDTTSAEFLAQKLESLLNFPELTQIPDGMDPDADLSDWIECCQLFKLDPDSKSSLDLIQVVGLKSRLYPYQVFGTYWQMKNSRINGGGFVGDEMGLGKTLSFLAYIVVERQLCMLWDLVAKDGKLRNRKHHESGAADAHLPCPSEHERPHWIACPCSTSSPSNRWEPKHGLRLAIVPPPLIKQWMGEWDKHIEKDSSLAMRLAVVHPPAFPLQGTPDVRDATRSFATKKYLASKRYRPPGKNTTEIDEVVGGQEKWLVLATKQYYYPWAKVYAYKPKTSNREKKPGENPGLIFGIAMVDECHENHFKAQKPKDPKKFYNRGGILYDLPITNYPFIWGYSGTPIVATPRGLEPILWSIEQRTRTEGETKSEWETKEELGLSEFTWDNFNRVSLEFENWTVGELGFNIMPELQEKLLPFLKKFLIRRTAESRWFRHPLMRLKPHYHHDIALKSNLAFTTELKAYHEKYYVPQSEEAAMESRRRFDALPAERRDLLVPPSSKFPSFPTAWNVAKKERLFATFPYLVKFALVGPGPKGGLTFEREETKRWARKTQYKQSLYYQNLDKIIDSSPKAAWLTNFLSQWSANNVEDSGETGNFEKRSKKLVIATQFDVVALILQLYFERYYPALHRNTKLITSTTLPRERAEILAHFATAPQAPTTARDRAAAAGQPPTLKVDIIIGNSQIIGKGLNLTRASTLILMEPQISFSAEAQIYSRVHRIGQQATVTHSYRLWCESKTARERERVMLSGRLSEPTWPAWEWEGKAVDRVRERKLRFGKKEKKRGERNDAEPGTDTGEEITTGLEETGEEDLDAGGDWSEDERASSKEV